MGFKDKLKEKLKETVGGKLADVTDSKKLGKIASKALGGKSKDKDKDKGKDKGKNYEKKYREAKVKLKIYKEKYGPL